MATITNKLHQKRKQVPDTEPAVIYCIIPFEWWQPQTDVAFGLRESTFQFFARSARINAVVYEWEGLVLAGPGAYSAAVSYPLTNQHPRWPIRLEFLFQHNPLLASELIASARKGSAELAELVGSGKYENTWSYLEWVRKLIQQ
jgi:hypothetical protein